MTGSIPLRTTKNPLPPKNPSKHQKPSTTKIRKKNTKSEEERNDPTARLTHLCLVLYIHIHTSTRRCMYVYMCTHVHQSNRQQSMCACGRAWDVGRGTCEEGERREQNKTEQNRRTRETGNGKRTRETGKIEFDVPVALANRLAGWCCVLRAACCVRAAYEVEWNGWLTVECRMME